MDIYALLRDIDSQLQALEHLGLAASCFTVSHWEFTPRHRRLGMLAQMRDVLRATLAEYMDMDARCYRCARIPDYEDDDPHGAMDWVESAH